MRWVGILLTGLVMSGCLGGAPPKSPDPRDGSGCNVLYPDGTPFECATNQTTTKVEPAAPALGSGWQCLQHYTDDGFPGAFDLFGHSDGRVGLYWNTQMDREGGYGYVEGAMFYGTDGQALVVPYRPTGFAVFPKVPPEKTVELHLLLRHFLLDVEEDGTWAPARNATMLVGGHKGHPWYVWNFDAHNVTTQIEVTVPSPDPAWKREYSPQKRYIETEDLTLFATVWGRGFRTAARSLTPDPLRQSGCGNLPAPL